MKSVLTTFSIVNTNKKYSKEAIYHLAKAIDGDDDSYEWLSTHSVKELAAFHDVYINQNETALTWLKKYGFDYLVNFYFSLTNNEKAQKLLLIHPSREWVLTVAASNGEHRAFNWLITNEFKHFAFLAMILNKEYNYGLDVFGTVSGFVGLSGTGSLGGFGGGSFGGGGAGGSW